MDFVDIASVRETNHRDEALARHSAAKPTRESLSHCDDCAQPIPLKRRLAVLGCERCIDCQTLHENCRA